MCRRRHERVLNGATIIYHCHKMAMSPSERPPARNKNSFFFSAIFFSPTLSSTMSVTMLAIMSATMTNGRTDKGILGEGYHFYQTFERCPGGQILQYKLSHQGVFYEGGCCVERNNSFCDQHHLLIRQLEEGAVVLVENVFLIICRICNPF